MLRKECGHLGTIWDRLSMNGILNCPSFKKQQIAFGYGRQVIEDNHGNNPKTVSSYNHTPNIVQPPSHRFRKSNQIVRLG
jgi:hypothetical protein